MFLYTRLIKHDSDYDEKKVEKKNKGRKKKRTKYRDKIRTSKIIKLSILSRVFWLVLLLFFIMMFALSKLTFLVYTLIFLKQ